MSEELKLNTDALLKLADLLESPEVEGHFDMSHWALFAYDHVEERPKALTEFLHDCGTVACIGGYGVLLFQEQLCVHNINSGETQLTKFLGLTSDQAQGLFYPIGGYIRCENPKAAAAVVRHLIATGEVDWTVADPILYADTPAPA